MGATTASDLNAVVGDQVTINGNAPQPGRRRPHRQPVPEGPARRFGEEVGQAGGRERRRVGRGWHGVRGRACGVGRARLLGFGGEGREGRF